jgi:hypothetical protein
VAADWRTIGALAETVGAYCWIERRLFALTGAWATEPVAPGPADQPELSVFLATASRQHAELAGRFYDRLPVRAGVDRHALVGPGPGPAAAVLERLAAEPHPLRRLAGLLTVVLPRLVASYEADLAQASPVREAPVMAVLGAARRLGAEEIRAGRLLSRAPSVASELGGIGPEFTGELERPLAGQIGIFPAARAS